MNICKCEGVMTRNGNTDGEVTRRGPREPSPPNHTSRIHRGDLGKRTHWIPRRENDRGAVFKDLDEVLGHHLARRDDLEDMLAEPVRIDG
jgi:hypothetical protein